MCMLINNLLLCLSSPSHIQIVPIQGDIMMQRVGRSQSNTDLPNIDPPASASFSTPDLCGDGPRCTGCQHYNQCTRLKLLDHLASPYVNYGVQGFVGLSYKAQVTDNQSPECPRALLLFYKLKKNSYEEEAK